jgi:hypothetical protein
LEGALVDPMHRQIAEPLRRQIENGCLAPAPRGRGARLVPGRPWLDLVHLRWASGLRAVLLGRDAFG